MSIVVMGWNATSAFPQGTEDIDLESVSDYLGRFTHALDIALKNGGTYVGTVPLPTPGEALVLVHKPD